MEGITMSLSSHLNPGKFWLAIMVLVWPASHLQAESDQTNVATEMAHALVAHECGKSRTPPMTAGFQAGVFMAINKLGLSEGTVEQILERDNTMTITDTLANQIFSDIEQGHTNCEKVYDYVVQALMPKLDAIGGQ